MNSASASAPKAKRRLVTSNKRTSKTKKPKGDKSTSTITTSTAQQPVNVYDAVLGEAQDLLTAAREAHALGRLKMASAYQLLLHARLVGLGKRFDRAQVSPAPTDSSTSQDAASAALARSPEAAASSNTGEAKEGANPPTTATPTSNPPAVAAEELAKLIPANIELDTAMMEHLARAAVELHHKRTGRRIQPDSLLASPPPGSTTMERTTPLSLASGGIAWTKDELATVQQALQQTPTIDPQSLSKLLKTRTEAQVKAYLKMLEQRQKGTAAVEEEFIDNTTNNNDEATEESPRKRGGRGRKPPTQAMNTVPNANLDARALLKGKAV